MARPTFILYCDESTKSGKHYSDFYGGALVNASDLNDVELVLQNKRDELNLLGELKWTKITDQYSNKYISFINLFFDQIESGRIKIRIMFTHNVHRARNLSDYHEENRYFLLYYQFIKHAFGFQYADDFYGDRLKLITLLDELPENKENCDAFRGYVNSLERFPPFRKRGWSISESDIADVDSKQHVILQGLDIILGAIQFRLNDRHKIKPEGSRVRGKRTIAKERVYKEINRRIRIIYPNFNIGISTGHQNGSVDRWSHQYRHWCFLPADREYVSQFVKKK
ncbi:uncharacterized protein DUF3800 [Breoghania corrubedonensis]|uniref:Uncharacterized protein DUF3800 n=1 Tax=Breoghania corrubedonensis TaxID=665038 RepID=A0A2T5VIB5_9HYPH|nr:DUF3800 domain-containing protein [Breoghania corrubedonensis]PTW63502.1 uncharacterized protein DUF3800 [Breoghania corrubedonensis]